MDQETREMFGKVLGVLGIMQTDINELKVDVAELKTDVAGLKVDVAELKTDVANMKTDINGLKTDNVDMKADINWLKGLKQSMDAFAARQDEMYLMLKGSEESRLRLKALEEKSSISAIERDQLKMDSAKIVGALRRGAHEILKGLENEDVS